MDGGNYHYTVKSLLHDAGRHRRSDHHGRECVGPHSGNCRCDDDHVIELRLVVAALNRLPQGTFTGHHWKSRLVDFFNAKHRNEEHLQHNVHLQKTQAVNKWFRNEHLSQREMKWINLIRDVWRSSRDQLSGFGPFKREMNSILRMS